MELTFFIIIALKTEKTEDVNAANMPSTIPCQYNISTEKIIHMAAMIIRPIKISYQIIFLRKIRGSHIAVNKVPVEKAAIVTETLDTLMAP